MASINARELDARGHSPGQEAPMSRDIAVIFSMVSFFLPPKMREKVREALKQRLEERVESVLLRVADPLLGSDSQLDVEYRNRLRDLGVVKTVHRPDAHGNK